MSRFEAPSFQPFVSINFPLVTTSSLSLSISKSLGLSVALHQSPESESLHPVGLVVSDHLAELRLPAHVGLAPGAAGGGFERVDVADA